MEKWADYLISEVSYSKKPKHIVKVKLHEDKGDTVGNGVISTREQVVKLLEAGKTVKTIFKNSEGKWNIGEPVKIINVNGVKYIKTKADSEAVDNLENLPEF